MMAHIQQEEKINLGAKKFNMWIFIFTSFMFFAALSSGFIVYSGGRGHGLNVKMPHAFLYSTIIIVISSVTLFIASRAAKQLQFDKQRLYLWVTFFLGIAFFIGLNTLRASYRNNSQVINLFKMEMTSIFWHFLDIIWIYLYVFLLLNQY